MGHLRLPDIELHVSSVIHDSYFVVVFSNFFENLLNFKESGEVCGGPPPCIIANN